MKKKNYAAHRTTGLQLFTVLVVLAILMTILTLVVSAGDSLDGHEAGAGNMPILLGSLLGCLLLIQFRAKKLRAGIRYPIKK